MQFDLIRNQDTDTDLLQDMLTDFISGFGMVNWNPSGCIADWYRFASGYWYRLDIRIAFRLPTFLNFAPQLLDLIVTIPDTSPDVCVFPFKYWNNFLKLKWDKNASIFCLHFTTEISWCIGGRVTNGHWKIYLLRSSCVLRAVLSSKLNNNRSERRRCN